MCSRDEWEEVERVLMEILFELCGGLESIQKKEMEHLQTAGMLFKEPTTQTQLAVGIRRSWPDASGIFVSYDRGLVSWLN